MLKYHISNVFLLKNKQVNTYIHILKKEKTNISFRYIYSNLFRIQLNSNLFRFQTKKTNTTLIQIPTNVIFINEMVK